MRTLIQLAVALVAVGGPVQAGEISGIVTVDEPQETRRPRRYFMGRYRSGRPQENNADARARNVVIYIEGLETRPETLPLPPEPVMRQKNERFIPHVLPILKNTAVSFPNEDDFYHNVFSVVAGDRFDLGRYAKGDRTSGPFEQSGVVVVRCEIHPGMKAYILVLSTPAYTVPDEGGAFRFLGLEAGRYTVHAWHPTQGALERHLDVPENGVVDVTFSF